MKTMAAEDIFDAIQKASRFGQPQNLPTTIVERLIEKTWCVKDDLVLAYTDLQTPALDRVVALYQLPFAIRLPDKWLKVRSQYGNPYVRFRSIQKNLSVANFEEPQRTQVLMSYQLWDRRRRLYVPYLESLDDPRGMVKTKLKSTGFLNAVEFEQNLVKRLRLQTIEVLREFIPVYKVICKDPFAFAPTEVDAFFVMVKNGKILRDVVSESKTLQATEKKSEPFDYSTNFTELRKRLKVPYRPTIYENYLLEAARQIEAGASNLAIVQTVMIIDWFANEMIEDHLMRKVRKALDYSPAVYELCNEYLWEDEGGRVVPSTKEKYFQYFPVLGISLPSHLIGRLTSLIDQRNAIVHRIQVEPIDKNDAISGLDTGMSIIRYCMDCLLNSSKHRAKTAGSEEV